MGDSELSELEIFATNIARSAGQLIQGYFGNPLKVEYKLGSQSNPVTEADKKSEDYLTNAIQKEFPGHGILAEEGSEVNSTDSDYTWIIDPLDGTNNFLNGFPVFAVSVGLLRRGIPSAGGIFLPSTTEQAGNVFHSSIGGGAFRDDKPIKVASSDKPQRGQLTALPSFHQRLFRTTKDLRLNSGQIRGPGSIAYELAMTASANFQYAVFGNPRIWDIAAGISLVAEAGGISLIQPRGKNDWEPFNNFANPSGKTLDPEALKGLNGSWIFGNRSIARYVAANMKRRSMLELRLRRWLSNRF